MSNFNPFFNNPYSAFLRQQDEERRRREGRLPGTTQQPDDDWAGRPVVKGRWPGKYPTLVEELPDSIADLPNWNEDDFRQLSPKILDAIFGSHATQISLLPTLLQIEKAEARKKEDQDRLQTKVWNSPNLKGLMVLSEGYKESPRYASLSEEEVADQEEYERRHHMPQPKPKPETIKIAPENVLTHNPLEGSLNARDPETKTADGHFNSPGGPYRSRAHRGVDIASPEGTIVEAAGDGRVEVLSNASG